MTTHGDAPDVGEMKVAVLGAGPAGLSAAHHLATNGCEVTVLEKNDFVGGLCVTYERNGFKFDLGGHRWFTKNEELHKWFLKLMEGELVTVERTSRIYFDGKYYNYPISIKNVLQNAGVFTSAHAMLSYLVAATKDLVQGKEPENLHQAFALQFGEKLYQMFFRRYSEKVWGRTCDEISADWSSQRSKGLSIITAVKDAIVKSRNVVSLVDEFVYPRDGYQRICDVMTRDVRNAGQKVLLESAVKEIRFNGPNDYTLVHESPDGADVELAVTDVISTIPLTHLVRMMQPAVPDEVIEAAKSLDFRDLITVTVMLKKEQVTPDTWLYVHDEDLLFARIHEPKNWSKAMVPGPEYTSVVCECFCSKRDDIWQLSEEAIGDRVVSDLADKLKFITRDEVVDVFVKKTTMAYPVYDLTYRGKVELLYNVVGERPGMHIVGRGGTFRYNNADHSVEMGQLLAKRLMGEENDPMSVNTEKAYHEEIRTTESAQRRAEGLKGLRPAASGAPRDSG